LTAEEKRAPRPPLEPRHYGRHGVDSRAPEGIVRLVEDVERNDGKKKPAIALNVIAVDPGHHTLASCVRKCNTRAAKRTLRPMRLTGPPGGESRSARRQRLFHNKMKELDCSVFNLTNKEWQTRTNQTRRRKERERMRANLGMHVSDDLLSKASARTADPAKFKLHVVATCQATAKSVQWMKLKKPRRFKFEAYQREQRTAKKLATDLLGGLSPLSTIVVWGNGGFGPTSRGHAPAPNQKMQRLLARYVPLITSSEYKSSKTSACCHAALNPLRHQGQKQRTTV
jgi:hypothetical protein